MEGLFISAEHKPIGLRLYRIVLLHGVYIYWIIKYVGCEKYRHSMILMRINKHYKSTK